MPIVLRHPPSSLYVADVEASGPAIDGELRADLEEADFLAVFALAGRNELCVIGTVRDDRADRVERRRSYWQPRSGEDRRAARGGGGVGTGPRSPQPARPAPV